MTNPSLNLVTVLDLAEEIIGRAKAQEDLEAVEETEEAVVEEVVEETFKVILLEGLVAVEVGLVVAEIISIMETIR